jgi:hypothetical protein
MARRLRLKGTDIYLKAIEYQNNFHGVSGMLCEYLNGVNKGKWQLIDGSCLIEETDPNFR